MQSNKQKIKHTHALAIGYYQNMKQPLRERKGLNLYLGVCGRKIVVIFCLQHVLWQILCFIILKKLCSSDKALFFQTAKSLY